MTSTDFKAQLGACRFPEADRCVSLRGLMNSSRLWWSRSWWAMGLWANSELTVAWFDSIGLPRLWKGDLNNTNRRMRTRMSGGVVSSRMRTEG